MVAEGVISRFTISVNNESLGRVSTLLMVDVVPGHFENVVSDLIKNGHVEEIMELQGAYVVALKITADNLAEIRDEIVRIRRIPYVTRTEMITILKTWKTT
jgi:DNA-binding Lrp family transcriptional regulator